MDLFETLDDLRNKIKDEILLNQNILKLVRYPTKKPLLEKDIDDVRSLVNDYIYFTPIAYDQVLQAEKTIILVDFDITPMRNRDNYVNIRFIVSVIVHNKLLEVEINNKIRDRAWAICGELSKSFINTSSGEWIGKCELDGFGGKYVSQDYYYCDIGFNVTNFKM